MQAVKVNWVKRDTSYEPKSIKKESFNFWRPQFLQALIFVYGRGFDFSFSKVLVFYVSLFKMLFFACRQFEEKYGYLCVKNSFSLTVRSEEFQYFYSYLLRTAAFFSVLRLKNSALSQSNECKI